MKRVLKAATLITILAVLAVAFCACDMLKVTDSPTRPGSEGDGSQETYVPDENGSQETYVPDEDGSHGTPAPDGGASSPEFTLSFDTDGGSDVPAITLAAGSALSEPEDPSKKGYTFAGWFRSNADDPYYFTTMPEWDFTLTAHWTVNSYTVTLYKNGGTCPALTSYVYGEGATLPIPAKAGCIFDGWFDNPDLSGTPVTEITQTATGDKEYWAKWKFIYQRVNAYGTPNASGEYILFGEYPQTEVTDSLIISALGDYDSNTWTSYDYYRTDMKYTDKEYNGVKYRGVWFSDPRNADQKDNGYLINTVYWFKYEPIKWRILNESGGNALILCDTAIDSQSFDLKDGSHRNNYKESTIRKWLNDTFYDTAFSSLQKELIQITTVDNSAASTGYSSNDYACADTEDKIFLLSYAEAANAAYGLNTAAARQKKSTDYAKAQGCFGRNSSYPGNSWWWLRSPEFIDIGIARSVYSGGDLNDYRLRYMDNHGNGFYLDNVDEDDYGVVPALRIKL